MNGPVRSKPRLVIDGTGRYGGFVTRFAVQKGWVLWALGYTISTDLTASWR